DAAEHARAIEDNREMAIALELDEPEDGDDRLPDGELLVLGITRARARATAVVDPVVAVGRHAQLAQPAKDHIRWCVDIDRAVERVSRAVEMTIARIRSRALLRGRAPVTNQAHRSGASILDSMDMRRKHPFVNTHAYGVGFAVANVPQAVAKPNASARRP